MINIYFQEEFDKIDSEIETVARDSNAAVVIEICDSFETAIDAEDALGARDW